MKWSLLQIYLVRTDWRTRSSKSRFIGYPIVFLGYQFYLPKETRIVSLYGTFLKKWFLRRFGLRKINLKEEIPKEESMKDQGDKMVQEPSSLETRF